MIKGQDKYSPQIHGKRASAIDQVQNIVESKIVAMILSLFRFTENQTYFSIRRMVQKIDLKKLPYEHQLISIISATNSSPNSVFPLF